LVRVVWAILFFAAGVGFLAYILAWIIIPEEVIM
jgi:phage shock protein PspC (stress-responsive transcriptional regulator)